MYGIIWIILKMIQGMMMKDTVSKYGSVVHNKVKPILCIVGLVPLIYYRGGVEVSWGVGLYIVLPLVLYGNIVRGTIYNKMLEKTPASVMNLVHILTAVTTFVIDMSVGRIPINWLVLLGVMVKLLGVWLCIRGEKVGNTVGLYKGIILVTLVVVLRMYGVNYLVNGGYTNSITIAVMAQMAMTVYTNIRYRAEKLEITRGMLKDYILQVVVTNISDIMFYQMVVDSVFKTIDYRIAVLMSIMLVERRGKLENTRWLGVVLVIVGIVYVQIKIR